MTDISVKFKPRTSIAQVEESNEFAPKFDGEGLLPTVTTDFTSGERLMQGYMNREALSRAIETGEAHYYSRSRGRLWPTGVDDDIDLEFTENEKVFDPEEIYGDAPNPTII